MKGSIFATSLGKCQSTSITAVLHIFRVSRPAPQRSWTTARAATTTGGAATLLSWNGEGRLSSLTQPTGAEERYAYDPAGLRRVKRAPEAQYVPDGENVLLELDAESGEPVAYTNAPEEWGGLVSQRQLANSAHLGFDLSSNTPQLTAAVVVR
ncbi:MAG TPA: RHS repeat domain-containing protein [Capsulimonadaceae bacterium]